MRNSYIFSRIHQSLLSSHPGSITVEHCVFAHTAFQLTFPTCATCRGGCNSLWNSAIINHCLQEALSYRCFSLWWVIPTETGWPTWSSAVSLIDRSYAPEGLYWLKTKKKNLLFKPEPGQFILWLSRQWNTLNPCEDCAAAGPEMNTKSHTEDENMPTQQVAVVELGAPGVRSDSSNHERWQCCGRCQFFQIQKKYPLPCL